MKKYYFPGLMILLALSINLLQAQIVEEALEGKGTFCYVTAGGGSVRTVNSPVRAGNIAHEHTASTSYKRAEIDDCSWHAYSAKDKVYWYGASYYLPSGSFNDDINTYVSQFRFSNIHEGGASEQNCTTRECGKSGNESGSGHHLKVKNQKWLYTLRHQDPGCADCKGSISKEFDLGVIEKDKWTDLVINAKWSHLTDGFIRIWKQVDDGGYELVLDYQGRTWYNKYADGSNREGQDVKAPNYTVGLYYSTKTDTRVMFTDEVRVYQENGEDGFSMVRPDQVINTCDDNTVKLQIDTFTTSSHIGVNTGVKLFDENKYSYWHSSGPEAYIELDFGTIVEVSKVFIAFADGNKNVYEFDILISSDFVSWNSIGTFFSSGLTQDKEVHDFDYTSGRYLKFVLKSQESTDFYMSTLEVCGVLNTALNIKPENSINLYPNPADNTLLITGLDLYDPLHIRFISIAGDIIYDYRNMNKSMILISEIPSGLYLIQIYSNKSKLIYNGKLTILH